MKGLVLLYYVFKEFICNRVELCQEERSTNQLQKDNEQKVPTV